MPSSTRVRTPVGGARRRGVRARRVGEGPLRVAPVGLGPPRPDGVRPARARRRAGRTDARWRSGRRLLEELLDPASERVRAVARLRGWPGAARGRDGAGPRGRRREAGGRAATAPAGARPSGRSSSSGSRTTSRSSASRAARGAGRSSARSSSARREADGLHWAGNVGSGLGDGDVEPLLAALRPLARADVAARRDAAHAPRPRVGRHVGRAGASAQVDVRRADA